jgi:OmpA-OmpF porin, OOP family
MKSHKQQIALPCNRKLATTIALCLSLLASVSAFAATADKATVKGLITGRTADSLTLKTEDGGKATIILADNTKVQHPRTRGIGKRLGLRKKQVSAAILIPGLKVSVEGTKDDQGRVVAKTITFKSNDLETAEMIQAGLHPTAQQVAANQQAIENTKQDSK